MGKFVTTTKKRGNVNINFSEAFKEIDDDIKESVKTSAAQFFRECVEGTPEDTGFAQSRWSADLLTDEKKSAKPLLSSKQASLESTQTKTVLKDGKIQKVSKSLGEVAYGNKEETIQKNLPRILRIGNKNINGYNINNDAPYILELEQGHSSQNSYWIRAAAKRLAGRIGLATSGGNKR